MRIVDDDDVKKIPEGDQVIWVCGSKMPAPDHPLFEQAMEDQCEYCRSTIVRNKAAPDNVTFLCLTCSHLCHKAFVDCGETPEVVMRSKDKKTFMDVNKDADFNELSRRAMDALINGPRRR